MMALSGTPLGSSQAGSIVGHCDAGAVKRALGCAAFVPVAFSISGVHFCPFQSRHSAGGASVMPSHHTPPSGVSATFVKMEFFASVAIALRLVFTEVPGADRKSTRLNSSHPSISYAVFCLKKKRSDRAVIRCGLRRSTVRGV